MALLLLELLFYQLSSSASFSVQAVDLGFLLLLLFFVCAPFWWEKKEKARGIARICAVVVAFLGAAIQFVYLVAPWRLPNMHMWEWGGIKFLLFFLSVTSLAAQVRGVKAQLLVVMCVVDCSPIRFSLLQHRYLPKLT